MVPIITRFSSGFFIIVLYISFLNTNALADNGEEPASVDIGLFNTECGMFEVRLQPDQAVASNITNIQFTLQWPEGSVDLMEFESDFQLEQQGPVFTENGYNYAVFVSVASNDGLPINWTEDTEYVILTFMHDQSGTNDDRFDMFIADNPWAIDNHGEFFVELFGVDATGEIYHEPTDIFAGQCNFIDMGLFNTDCGFFEVTLKPFQDIASNITNIQFTLKWPENTVGLLNFESDYGLGLQGDIVVEGGYNYAVFVSVAGGDGLPINWTEDTEYVILTFEHDQSGAYDDRFDMFIADDQWATDNNGEFFVELFGLDATGDIYHEPTDIYAGECFFADIGLFNTECGLFEVRLQPYQDVSSDITNIQFTLKWPANTAELINFESDFGLELQGDVVVDDGFNYAVFVSVPASQEVPVNWLEGEEYTVLSFAHDQSGPADETFDMFIADDPWAVDNNGEFFFELFGLDATGEIYHEPADVNFGACNFVYLRVILQGAYVPVFTNATIGPMRTDLNEAGLLPAQQPYDAEPWNYTGNEEVTAFPDSIVDWVLIELRDKDDHSILRGIRAGLLTKSGMVMGTNLIDGLAFDTPAGDYYLVVKHRNHMPVMSGSPVSFPNGPNAPYDFTEIENTTPYKHEDPLPTMIELPPLGSGKYGMIAGNVVPDNQLIYIGPNNDSDPIIKLITDTTLQTSISQTITGYFAEDVNMDGIIKYIGNNPANDSDIIIANLAKLTGATIISVIYYSVVPDIIDP